MKRRASHSLHLLTLAVGCAASSVQADSAVVFNEIMYHPLTNEAQLEWVELQNQMAVDVDISQWRLDGGIDFRFPEGTVVRAGNYLVIASSPATLMSAAGLTNVLGPFANRLSNAGERLRLRNNDSRIMDEVTYGVEGDWPVAPDGAGPSLARRRTNTSGSDARHWTASAQIGGTPGAENFPVKPPTVISNTVAMVEGSWRFNDAGIDLGTGWRRADYDDSGWASGLGLFYQGDAPLPAAKNTPLTPGRTTYYFRTAFVVTGDVSRVQLQLRPVIDDGAVGYLNGTEIFRLNMPPGDVNYSTLANGVVANAAFGETIVLYQVPAGTNVLAVEVHQAPQFAAYAQVVVNSTPVGYWRLGETSGTALDSSPVSGAQNGTYSGFLASNRGQAGPRPTDAINATALSGFEADNAAPRFAGDSDGGNDVITIPDNGVLNFSSSRIFTLEAWVNGAAAQESSAGIIAKGTGGGGEQFAIDVFGGVYRFFGWDGGTPNNAAVAGATVGPNGTWQHLVAVLDQPAGRMKLYINGVERASATPRPTLLNTTHEVSIGARKNIGSAGYDLNFDGRIDEVAIYNRALTPAEITAHFNAAFTNNAAAGPDTNDVVFGLEVVTAETLPEPEPIKVAFNELASSTNAAFGIELINCGRTDANLGGWTIARFGGATNREYVIPSQTLAPGELRQISKAEMGFGADSGDRLVLYTPGRTNVADAVVAKKDPRGRSPDGTGAWWFPNQPTPGLSNRFVFHDELVINEIMFHQRELLAETATYSPTNLLMTISNVWKYHAEGIDLGTEWRAPNYDDSSWMASNAVFYAPTNPFTLPAPKNTFLPLTNSSGARIITFYFRTQFTFSGQTNALRLGLRAIVDDGAVFYLNGGEVYRLNLPATNISYGTLATANVGIPGFTGPVVIPITNLVQGLNTIAVEVHQVTPASNDFDFGTELLSWYELTPALPFRNSPESWVEIFNRSSNTVDLTGWRLDEGIDYRFVAGKTLAPGGYLVVARDVSYMQSLYPGLDVVGPFTNKLSLNSDYLVLKDPGNNLADEVRYFGGGRWGEYPDGGGSSLELRDPWADHMQAEAWVASDESAKSQWQTFTWRGVSAAGQTGEPTLWHEFAFCLLDGAGEVLLDDVSVVENPAGTSRQLIVNGDFSSGTTHWRFLGNHRPSHVEPESGNPGNSVLHLVATGPGEYQGNQIETTFANNAAIIDGREYEISFRARWLAGKRKLNARLYFNRLARTFDLPVPLRTGTPGAENSRYTPNIGPTCSGLAHSPAVPNQNQPVRVSVSASDPQGIASLVLNYSTGGGPWQATPMIFGGSSNAGLGTVRPPLFDFTGTIPGQPSGTLVQFYVQGTDTLGAMSSFPAGGTNSRALYVVQDNQAAPAPLQNLRIVMTSADATWIHTGTNTLSNELLGCTVVSNEREVFYDAGVRLKGSFVGRNVARVGFHVVFDPEQLFRGVHRVVSVDRSQHTGIGGVGEIVVKHIGNHAGAIPGMYDDLARCIAPLSSYTSQSELRLSGFDNDYLDAQFKDGSDGPMFEVEVLRWNVATVDGNPESPKQVGNESGGTGYANLEVQSYGDNQESYRWFFLQNNRRTADDYTRAIALAKTFSLSGTALSTQAVDVLDVDQWLRTMAYEELVGVADAYFTGLNIHNFRAYVRPEDQKVLYLPWDWDSSFLASSSAPIVGTGNIAKLLDNPNNRRAYLNHLFDIITTTFNPAYISRWTTHYGAVGGQDTSGILNYITARRTFVLSQLPTATAFAITNNGGNNLATSNSTITIAGTAPIAVKTIEINGVAYPATWLGPTTWLLTVPLYGGTNLLVIQGIDNYGNRLTNAFDTITVTNQGPSALQPVVINEWMADNAGPLGLADPADGLFQDWFELFNPNTNSVSLAGFFLTDNLSQPSKWQIPAGTIIGARNFLLVWADNQPEQNADRNASADLHAGFQLSSGGEAIGLFSPSGVVQHTVIFGPQIENVSEGLFPDGNTNGFHSMTNWTPRAPNTLAGPLSFTTISLDNGTLTLMWSAIPGRAYRIEFKDELSAELWTQLGDELVAFDTTLSITDTPPAFVHRFYRVIRLE
jgi:hypothetical protein